MNNRYQIQRQDRCGEWEDVFKGDFDGIKESKMYALEWAKYNPKCAWGVRVVDTLDNTVVYEP